MKLKNKALRCLIAFLPLLIAETIILAFDYYEKGNFKVNLNLSLIFGAVALMTILGKVFFDFIVTLITNKCTGTDMGAGDTAQTLIAWMPVQFAVLLIPIALMVAGVTVSAIASAALIALANTVYYVVTGISMYRSKGKKAYIAVFAVMALASWITVIA